MKLALFSDLHIEHIERLGKTPARLPAPQAEAIILAGDIHRAARGLRWARAEWPDQPILFVAGNHEFYGLELFKTLAEMHEVADETGIHLLTNHVVVIDDIRFLGTPLWTDFSLYGTPLSSAELAASHVNDFKVIYDAGAPLATDTMARLHREAKAFLRSELAKPWNGKTVVITHWLPHPDCIQEHYRGDRLSPFFCCNCSDLLSEFQIDLWVFGHTHGSCDARHASGCRLLSNQRGYPSENPIRTGFQPNLLIEV